MCCRSHNGVSAHFSVGRDYAMALRCAFLLKRQGSGIHQRVDGE